MIWASSLKQNKAFIPPPFKVIKNHRKIKPSVRIGERQFKFLQEFTRKGAQGVLDLCSLNPLKQLTIGGNNKGRVP